MELFLFSSSLSHELLLVSSSTVLHLVPSSRPFISSLVAPRFACQEPSSLSFQMSVSHERLSLSHSLCSPSSVLSLIPCPSSLFFRVAPFPCVFCSSSVTPSLSLLSSFPPPFPFPVPLVLWSSSVPLSCPSCAYCFPSRAFHLFATSPPFCDPSFPRDKPLATHHFLVINPPCYEQMRCCFPSNRPIYD